MSKRISLAVVYWLQARVASLAWRLHRLDYWLRRNDPRCLDCEQLKADCICIEGWRRQQDERAIYADGYADRVHDAEEPRA